MEKLNITKASNLRLWDREAPHSSTPGHLCPSCTYQLSEDSSEIFDILKLLEMSKMSLSRPRSEVELLEVTTFYYTKFGDFTQEIYLGGPKVLTDLAVQWCVFCFVMFEAVKENVCRTSFMRIFMDVSEYYGFCIETHHYRILVNVF